MKTYDQQQLRAWSAGLDVASGLLGFGFIGWLIDRWLGHAPWWMLGLGLTGLCGGSYRFIREAIAVNRAAAARYRKDHGPARDAARSSGVDDHAVDSRDTGSSPENQGPSESPDV